ncbi:MAG: PilZ domain-containing protein [Deferribacteres bacterium]|nr:PilZ domain-containing protein [Deferribacteres bacterium]
MVVERRKFRRFKAPLDAQITLLENPSKHASGTIRDFSREGLCLESRDLDMSVNAPIELMVRHPRKDTLVHITGDIRWSEQSGTSCLAGIKIKEMDKEAKGDILDYAYSLWVDGNKG